MLMLKHNGFYYSMVRIPASKVVWKTNIITASVYCTNNVRNKSFLKLNITWSNNIASNIRNYSLLNRTNYNRDHRSRHKVSTLVTRNVFSVKTQPICITNNDIADLFVDLIKEDLLENGTFVIETSPHRGYLTKRLLDAGLPKLYVFEAKLRRTKEFKLLLTEYSDRLEWVPISFFALTNYLSGRIILEVNAAKEIMPILPTGEWTAAPCMQVIGIADAMFFMNQIITATIFQSNLLSRGRISFYVAIGPFLWKTLTGSSDNLTCYKYSSVLFQLFFNYKLFGAIHDPKFESKFKIKAYNRFRSSRDNRFGVQIVKVEPKPELFSIMSKDHLLAFWLFLRIIMYRRTNRLIPVLENWAPGCGPLLITENINMYTYVGDLSPQKLLSIFQQFSSWPEYQHSQFYQNFEELRGLGVTTKQK